MVLDDGMLNFFVPTSSQPGEEVEVEVDDY